jgi:hypothetical protein
LQSLSDLKGSTYNNHFIKLCVQRFCTDWWKLPYVPLSVADEPSSYETSSTACAWAHSPVWLTRQTVSQGSYW